MPEYRYCTECILTNIKPSLENLKLKYSPYGDSLIIAGSAAKLHLHIHTNNPGKLFLDLHKDAEVTQVKADDMLSQYNIVNHKKYSIGLMTDTAADLPGELLEKHQIIQVPFGISFGNNQYLDKFTIQPETFYDLLRHSDVSPKSSVPALKVMDTAMRFLDTQYDKSICLHISSQLSSIYQTGYKLAEKHQNVAVIDSRHLSVSQGLLLLRIARAIESEMPYESIIKQANEWSSKTFIYTDIATLKYMIRSGRVSPLKGFIANLMNVKPIVSVDKDGKGIAWGKSFSRKANMHKILDLLSDLSKNNEIWEYAIVHSDAEARANQYAARLKAITGKAPVYIMPLSPVIGVHNGLGTVAVGISLK